MRQDYFVFNDFRSLDCNVILSQVKTESTPKRELVFSPVPGRNGDMLQDQKRWGNVKISYSCAIIKEFPTYYQALKNGLYKSTGYHRLEDTIHPDEFRIGAFCEALEPKTARYNQTGTFDVVFNCKPQRFLKSGEIAVCFSEDGSLHNGTAFAALPQITVFGAGAGLLRIGKYSVEIKSITEPLILDCDMQNAYSIGADGGVINQNAEIYAPEFPKLLPGDNTVTWEGDISALEIVPRWWML